MQQTHYQLFHLIHYMILIINLTDQILTWIKKIPSFIVFRYVDLRKPKNILRLAGMFICFTWSPEQLPLCHCPAAITP